MPNQSNWDLRGAYDYRFGTYTVQVRHNGDMSPVYQIPMRDVLRLMPRHEVLSCIQLADEPNPTPDGNIDLYRKKLIEETDLKGKVVLDIGGYDGWAAKVALDCGARQAICLDNHQYEHYGWEDKKYEGVLYVQGNPFEKCFLPYEENPDIIIFYNVLYHLKNPWAALDYLRSVISSDGELLLCTLFRYHNGSWVYLYEPRECNPGDETVYFGPSLEALERLLRLTGWDTERYYLSYDRVLYRCKPTPGWERKHEDS